MFHHGCEGMHGMVRRARSLFRLVAMASPEEMGRNGSMFCAHLCQHLGAWEQWATTPSASS